MIESKGYLQLKGTNICMDFHCECGTHNHYDGYFIFYIKCSGCGQDYKVGNVLTLEKTNEAIDPAKSEIEE